MPGPAVVIEMAQADRASAFASALVEACSRSIAEGCKLGGAGEAEAPALAILTWQEDHRVLRIEVGLRRVDHADWLTRRIEFRPEDQEIERWRAAGLVVATLAGDVRAGVTSRTERGEAPPTGAPKPPPRATPAPSVRLPPRPPGGAQTAPRTGWIAPEVIWVDAGPLFGSGLDGAPRVGASLRLFVALPGGPLAATGAARYAARVGGDIGATWASGSIGLATTFTAVTAIRIGVRAEGALEVLRASVGSAAEADAGTRLLPTARVGADAAWMPSARIGLVASGEVSFGSATAIRVRGQLAAREAPIGAAALVGVRVRIQ